MAMEFPQLFTNCDLAGVGEGIDVAASMLMKSVSQCPTECNIAIEGVNVISQWRLLMQTVLSLQLTAQGCMVNYWRAEQCSRLRT